MAYLSSDPKWLQKLERYMPWLAIPRIAIILITLQAFGFFLVNTDPLWMQRLALLPDHVLVGHEWWRLVTFLALPLSLSPIWMIFACWFLYSILDWIENEWGAFKTTLYVGVSIILTIIFALVFNYPVWSVQEFNSTLFLAAAALFPDQEIRLYMVLPVKMKYMGWLSLAFFGYHLFAGDWLDRLFLITIYSNYFLFFGPQLISQVKDWKRRRDYRARMRD
jgi:membrane associated rhomboid family serine protease